MCIRAVNNNDIKNIYQLVKSLSHFYLKNKGDALPEWFLSTLTESAFSERIKNSEYSNFAYEENDKVLGYISIKNNQHLYHLFVAENHHKKGIARKLWDHVTQHCQSKIYTLRSSLYAVPIYRKFGFIESNIIQNKDGISFQEMELHYRVTKITSSTTL